MYLEQVEREMREFGAGVRGVPFFIIDGNAGISGAQEPRVFEEVFEGILCKGG